MLVLLVGRNISGFRELGITTIKWQYIGRFDISDTSSDGGGNVSLRLCIVIAKCIQVMYRYDTLRLNNDIRGVLTSDKPKQSIFRGFQF